ncbi:hypothetical protein SLE2022_054400 [Rubroshorea leprosula]
MNPPSIPHSFHFHNPNPNPTFSFFPSHENPNLVFNSFSTPTPDLSTTLSSLNSLISLTQQILDSHFSLLNSQNDTLVSCPFNRHHLMPPESLFHHSLRCPAPLSLDPLNISNSPNPSSDVQHRESHLIQGSNTELCFSLDNYLGDLGLSFFYKDCPGVVSLNDKDSSKKTFTLPGVLSVECANLVGFREGEIKDKDMECYSTLPSDLWAIRREVEGWADCPNFCSFKVTCGILGSNMVGNKDLRRWVIANSPRYGILIDGYAADHILLLFKLCLKAIVREALGFSEVEKVSRDVKKRDLELSLECRNFNCPILVQVLMWLALQLSILYGEAGGKLFAISILKQCILEGALRLSLLHLEKRMAEFCNFGEQSQISNVNGTGAEEVKVEEQLKISRDSKLVTTESATVGGGVIFVSQVAAAIAALHEHSFLEEKIKQLQASQQLNRYRRMAEHAYLSERANEERKKRSNYRPIIEHDGLPRQPSANQETNKAKTREEILAEERDYKRRRMSYRGKKSKRSPLEVMRDLIEEYTEEIKNAGGIGCFVKQAEVGGIAPLPTAHSPHVDIDDQRKSTDDITESERGSLDHYGKRSRRNNEIRSVRSEDASGKDNEQSRWSKHEDHDHCKDPRSSDMKRRSEGYPGSSKRHRNHGVSDERISHRKERDNSESSRSKYYKNRRSSSSMSKHQAHRSSYSMSNPSDEVHRRKFDLDFGIKDRNHRSLYGNFTSDLEEPKGFGDRYDP